MKKNTVTCQPCEKTISSFRVNYCVLVKLVALIFGLLITHYSFAQDTGDTSIVDYSKPIEYTIGGITVTGTQYLDKDILITLAGLKVNDKIQIPGPETAKAIQNLWKQGLFAGVAITISKIEGDKVYLNYELQERPRLSSFTFKGIKKGQQDDLRDKVKLMKGKVLTDNITVNTKNSIHDYYVDKGYLHPQVDIRVVKDTAIANGVIMFINIDKGKRVKIDNITFSGNTNVKSKKLRHLMKKTKENPIYSVFTVSKFMKKDYVDDKEKIIAYYNTKGYRDVKIISDTVYQNKRGNLNIHINIGEGDKFYFRNITFSGNSKYSSGRLDSILDINKGEVYNEELLQKRLTADPNGNDISSLYMDDGYLFFSATPTEVGVQNDSIDLEIKIYEGPQATISSVNISGNTKTSEHVLRRIIRTVPGNKFSRADVIRSQREIATLGFFNPEKIGITPEPHPETGTVDINYSVEEKPSDQLELSAGYGGAGQGVVGALGVSFNNFSLRNMFVKHGWDPIPAGDGQRLSLRVNTNGKQYQSYTASFTEPWLGGKKPNSLSLSFVRTRYSNGYIFKKDDPNFGFLTTNGGAIGYGKQLKFPDDYFTLISSLDYQRYSLKNYPLSYFEGVNSGEFNNLGLTETLSRNSIDNPQYPMRGSNFSLVAKFTPPYSAFGSKDYRNLAFADKFKWIEYHKYRITAEWYSNVFSKFVIKTSAKMGFIGYYNKDIGISSFERFNVSSDPLTNYIPILGQEAIYLRGYQGSISSSAGSTIFNKFTAELRYPFSTNPSTFIYGLVFAEAGNGWDSFREYNPYQLKRTAGIGLRVFLPAFGLLGVDFGIGFDNDTLIKQSFGDKLKNGKFSIILGFEPD